jgi:hypothetical protein
MDANHQCEFVRVLAEDLPGEHWYVFRCRKCLIEAGPEFVIRHHGVSDPVPLIAPRICRAAEQRGMAA